MSRSISWRVCPRYTPGSPGTFFTETGYGRRTADVKERVLRIASEESLAYEHALSGVYGDDGHAEARQRGLGGIVEQWYETKSGWQVEDLITGERFFRLSRLKVRGVEVRSQDRIVLMLAGGQPLIQGTVDHLRRQRVDNTRRKAEPDDQIVLDKGQRFKVREIFGITQR